MSGRRYKRREFIVETIVGAVVGTMALMALMLLAIVRFGQGK